jgi:hypothetical protein
MRTRRCWVRERIARFPCLNVTNALFQRHVENKAGRVYKGGHSHGNPDVMLF